MALELVRCTDADMPRFFEIVSRGFGVEHEYFNLLFPDHTSPAGRRAGAARLLAIKNSNPHAVFLKVTDPAAVAAGAGTDDQIIGVAKWDLFDKDGDGPALDAGLGTQEYWDSPEEARYADTLYRLYMVPRRTKIKESNGHLASLDILAVDPKHHYRGAGRMLVDWGTKRADEMDVEAVVEASVYGRHLYEICGFQKVSFVTLNVPDEFEALVKMKQRYFWMVRPKTSAAAFLKQ